MKRFSIAVLLTYDVDAETEESALACVHNYLANDEDPDDKIKTVWLPTEGGYVVGEKEIP